MTVNVSMAMTNSFLPRALTYRSVSTSTIIPILLSPSDVSLALELGYKQVLIENLYTVYSITWLEQLFMGVLVYLCHPCSW